MYQQEKSEQPRFIDNTNCNDVIPDLVCEKDFTCNSSNKCEQVKNTDQEK